MRCAPGGGCRENGRSFERLYLASFVAGRTGATLYMPYNERAMSKKSGDGNESDAIESRRRSVEWRTFEKRKILNYRYTCRDIERSTLSTVI